MIRSSVAATVVAACLLAGCGTTTESPGAAGGPAAPASPSPTPREIEQATTSPSAETPARSTSQIGVVKWFNDAKGFGFLVSDRGGADVFVHHSAIIAEGFRTLTEGDRVAFSVVAGPKGLQAKNVVKID